MNIMTTRTALSGARFSRLTARHLATVDAMVARAAAFGGGGRMMASATDTAPTDPAPAAPSTPVDTTARLDAQLQDHEARIAGLEQRSPPPAPVDTSAQAALPSASAVAFGPASRMPTGTEIYNRMNSRPTGQKVAAVAPAPVMFQTAAGTILNARAIHDRHNAVAAARTDPRR